MKPYSLEELREMRGSITQEDWDNDAYIGADDYDDPDLPFVQIGDIRWTPNKVDIPAAIETNDNARVMAAAPALLDQLISVAEENEVLREQNFAMNKRLEADRWIPVSERLPEKEGEYLVILSNQNNRVCIRYYYGKGWWDAVTEYLTHWKPLPPAPEGE